MNIYSQFRIFSKQSWIDTKNILLTSAINYCQKSHIYRLTDFYTYELAPSNDRNRRFQVDTRNKHTWKPPWPKFQHFWKIKMSPTLSVTIPLGSTLPNSYKYWKTRLKPKFSKLFRGTPTEISIRIRLWHKNCLGKIFDQLFSGRELTNSHKRYQFRAISYNLAHK